MSKRFLPLNSKENQNLYFVCKSVLKIIVIWICNPSWLFGLPYISPSMFFFQYTYFGIKSATKLIWSVLSERPQSELYTLHRINWTVYVDFWCCFVCSFCTNNMFYSVLTQSLINYLNWLMFIHLFKSNIAIVLCWNLCS